MKSDKNSIEQLAGIEYAGLSGTTFHCLRALARKVQSGDRIERACLVTEGNQHAFIVFSDIGDPIVIKNGFSSGYSGEGPTGLSAAIDLLDRHNIEIEEYEVDEKFIGRVEFSCLTNKDIEWIQTSRPIRPRRLYGYLFRDKQDLLRARDYLASCSQPSIPYGIIDERIQDLAIAFHKDEDRSIFAAYRRLEDIVRSRSKISESGAKLFSKAFLSEDSPLTWNVGDDNEAKGRANLYTAIFGAFRNVRMHREQKQTLDEALREFLLVNELFRLEALAVDRQSTTNEHEA